MAFLPLVVRRGLFHLTLLAAVSLLCVGAASAQSKSKNKPQANAPAAPAAAAKEKDPDLGDADKDDPLGRLQWQIEQFGGNTAAYKRHVLNEARKHNQRLGRGTGRFGAVTPQDNTGAGNAAPGMATFNPQAGVGPMWVNIGPTGADFEQNGSTTYYQRDSGRLRTILAHPTDPNTLYILSSAGGLWVTHNLEDSNTTWEPLTDFLPTTAGGAVAFGKSPSTLYLGLGDPFDQITVGGSIVKSSDGGETWSSAIDLGNAISVRDLQVDTSTATDIVLVATDNGLWRSVDGGLSYAQVGGGAGQPFEGQQAWSIVRSSAGWLVETQACGVGYRWCAAAGNIYRSTDLGATWTLSSTGFTNAGRATLGVGAPGDSVVYAFAALPNGTVSPGQRDLFKSIDGGLTWTALGITTKAPANPNSNNRDMNLMHVQAWYNQMILVDPTDQTRNTVYLGGDLSTAKTTDGGNTWALLSNWISGLPYVHADCHAAAYKSAGTPSLLFGTDGGIFISSDNGATWSSSKNSGVVTHMFYTITGSPNFPNFAMGGLQDNGTRARFGQTGVFNQINGGDGFGVAMSQANNEASMVSVYNLSIRRGRSRLAPQSYTEMESSLGSRSDGGFYTPIVAAPAGADPTGKYFFTYSAVSGVTNSIYFTPDGGLLWYYLASAGGNNSTGTPNGLPANAVFRDDPFDFTTSPTDLCRMAIGANGGRAFVSTDCGDNWTQVLTAGPPASVNGWLGYISNVTFADDTTLYVTSVSQAEGLQNGVRTVRVVKSIDTGSTWSDASNGLPDVPVTRVLVDPRDPTHNTVYAATHVGVYRTTDGGANWAPYGTGLPNVRVNDMYMPPDGGTLRIATYGRGIWELGQMEFVAAAMTDDGNSCDHNGVLGNGETGHLTVTLHNVSSAPLNGVVATIASDNPHLTFPGGNSVMFPYADANSDVTASVPVALNGATGIEQANVTVAFGDASLPAPATVSFLQRFNYDVAPLSSTTETFESADNVWTTTGPALKPGDVFNWERRELSPVQHAFGLTASNGVSDNSLISPTLHTGTGPVSFSFKHRHTLQISTVNNTTHVAGWADGAVVEISVGGGAWTDLGPYLSSSYGGYYYLNGVPTFYTGTVTQSSNPLNTHAAFGGKNKSFPDYDVVTVNLGTDFADKDIRVRFRLGTNTSSGTQGWEIDEVSFSGLTNAPYTALVAHNEACASGTSLTSLPNPSVLGVPVAFAATVSGGVTTATGTVVLKEGSTTLGSAAAANGQASINVSSLTVGTHNVNAYFEGDAGHASSVSDSYAQIVTDFQLGGSAPAVIDRSGTPATFATSVTSIGGFAGTVTFSCSNLPQYATCSVNPVSVPANGTVAVPLTINVEQASGADKGTKKSKVMPGTYQVTLIGTSGGANRSVTVTFTIQ